MSLTAIFLRLDLLLTLTIVNSETTPQTGKNQCLPEWHVLTIAVATWIPGGGAPSRKRDFSYATLVPLARLMRHRTRSYHAIMEGMDGFQRKLSLNGRFPQVSGLCFGYDISAPVGSRVTSAVRQAADGSCTGAPVDLTAASTYAIAENDFMANGGDEYPNFASRTVTREFMDEDLADYIAATELAEPAMQGRIVCTTSGVPACPIVTPPAN